MSRESTAPPMVDYAEVRRLADAVNAQIEGQTLASEAPLGRDDQRQLAMALLSEHLRRRSWESMAAGGGPADSAATAALRDAVMESMFGLGRLAPLLSETSADGREAEDIIVHSSRPVIVQFAGGALEERPPVFGSDEEMMAQVAAIATYQGMGERGFSRRRPWLDMNLVGHRARLAFLYGVTPHPVLTIRRHRFVNITLETLVSMGTISRAMMAYLQAAVIGGRSIVVVGDQAAGKTTLLRALALLLPSTTAFATMETEFELLLHDVEGRFPLLIPVEEQQGSGEMAGGKEAGRITLADVFPSLLRHRLRRFIFGEVRDAEILCMVEAMSRGARGSMATFHANSARETFGKLATLYVQHSPKTGYEAALRQVAEAVDIVVYLDMETTTVGDIRYVSTILENTGKIAADGTVVASEVFAPDRARALTDPRGYPTGLTTERDELWLDRAGLDVAWLTRPDLGGWDRPAFPERLLGR